MIFGKRYADLVPGTFTLNDESVQFVSEWKYLGWFSPSSAYDFLSTENVARIVGLSLGREACHPAT